MRRTIHRQTASAHDIGAMAVDLIRDQGGADYARLWLQQQLHRVSSHASILDTADPPVAPRQRSR